MWYYVTKIVISALLILMVSEIAKRSSVFGAVVASLPLISIIAMVWLYHDTADTAKVAALATDIFWLVIPSLALFLSLPVLLKYGMSFYLSLGISICLTVLAYTLMLTLLNVIRA